MSHEELLRRIEHLERSVRWRTRFLAAAGALAVLGAATASQPTSLVIGKEGGPMVTIEDGVLEFTDRTGHRARLAAHEFQLVANEHETILTADGLGLSTRKPDFWTASSVNVSTSGLRVESADAVALVGPFFVKVGAAGGAIEMSVAPEGGQGLPGSASLELEAGPKLRGGVIRLDAPQGKAPVLVLAPSGTAPSVTLSTDGKLSRKPGR
jgi:hypothetical protein